MASCQKVKRRVFHIKRCSVVLEHVNGNTIAQTLGSTHSQLPSSSAGVASGSRPKNSAHCTASLSKGHTSFAPASYLPVRSCNVVLQSLSPELLQQISSGQYTFNKSTSASLCPSSYINTVTKEKTGVDEQNIFPAEQRVATCSYMNHIIKNEVVSNEDMDSFPGFSAEELCPSLYIHTIIKEKIDRDEENNFLADQSVAAYYCVNPIIKGEMTGEGTDIFPGFSAEELKSSKLKTVIMERFVFNERKEEDCMEDGSKNITGAQKDQGAHPRASAGGRSLPYHFSTNTAFYNGSTYHELGQHPYSQDLRTLTDTHHMGSFGN